MYKRLAYWSCERCVAAGRRVLARLGADPRLSDVAAEFGIAQTAFEEKVTAYVDAEQATGLCAATHDATGTALEDRLRELGLGLLGTTRNHHQDDAYRAYYPDGYGDVMRIEPSRRLEFADLVREKLARETDPRILSFREPIDAARDRYVEVKAQYEACLRAEREAEAFREIEKRRWIRALAAARHKAEIAYPEDPAHVRALFDAVAQHRHDNGPEEPEAPAAPAPAAPALAAPAASGAPAATAPPAAPAPAGTAGASGSSPAPGGTPAPGSP